MKMDFLDWPHWVWAITFLAITLALYWISRSEPRSEPSQRAKEINGLVIVQVTSALLGILSLIMQVLQWTSVI
jgi:hypothetical protein